MADSDKKYITRIRLSNNQEYTIKDSDAARIADLEHCIKDSGGTITGNLFIDGLLQTKNLKVITINDMDVAVDNVLTQDSDGTIKKRDADQLLADIGGMTCEMDPDEVGLLVFKIGK